MKRGTIYLYCPICGHQIDYNESGTSVYRHKDFGILCSKLCFEEALMKYARLVPGHSDPPRPQVKQLTTTEPR